MILHYKNFIGSMEYDKDYKCFGGQLFGLDDYITYWADNEQDLFEAFKKEVDSYISKNKMIKFNYHLDELIHIIEDAIRVFKSSNEYTLLGLFDLFNYELNLSLEDCPDLLLYSVKNARVVLDKKLNIYGKEVEYIKELYLDVTTKFLTLFSNRRILDNESKIYINIVEYEDIGDYCFFDNGYEYSSEISKDEMSKLSWKLNDFTGNIQIVVSTYDELSVLEKNIQTLQLNDKLYISFWVSADSNYKYYEFIVDFIQRYKNKYEYEFIINDITEDLYLNNLHLRAFDAENKGFKYMYNYFKSHHQVYKTTFCNSLNADEYSDVFVESL